MAEEKKTVGIPWEKRPLEGEELRKRAQEVADGVFEEVYGTISQVDAVDREDALHRYERFTRYCQNARLIVWWDSFREELCILKAHKVITLSFEYLHLAKNGVSVETVEELIPLGKNDVPYYDDSGELCAFFNLEGMYLVIPGVVTSCIFTGVLLEPLVHVQSYTL